MYYKNRDYTARTRGPEGGRKYYIQFHGLTQSPEIEVDQALFQLYLKEFNKPLERQRNERRFHLDERDYEYLSTVGELANRAYEEFEMIALKQIIEATLDSCTQTQQRRFLYYINEYKLVEIAEMEGCSKVAVKHSVDFVKKLLQEKLEDFKHRLNV